jgi:HK97 family phage portal protein
VKIGNLEITWRRKAVPENLSGVNSSPGLWGSWFGPIRESFAGAWQQGVTVAPTPTLLSFSAVYSCVTGIASDIAKLRIKLVRNDNGIWNEITSGSPFLSVLNEPNRFQVRHKFIEQWILSKLLYGNAYILKQRDGRGVVDALYVLHPACVKALVAEDGSVYYEINRDYLSQVPDRVVIPQKEIIHDMMVSLWHPLIGVSPIYACGLSATMGNTIQSNSTRFFGNRSMPGGMLYAPGNISDATAARLKGVFESSFGSNNLGRLFVGGDGLEFKPFSIPAQDAQLIEQLKWTVEDVARAFRYPIDKLGMQNQPYSTAQNVEARTIAYYTDCLQTHIELLEAHLDRGLELPAGMGTELDLDNLWRMDTTALFESTAKGVGAGILAPNEARKRLNLPPVPGGDTPYLQQQNYSLQALAKRDALDPPAAAGAGR